jgi:hypothetical protein
MSICLPSGSAGKSTTEKEAFMSVLAHLEKFVRLNGEGLALWIKFR